MKTNIVKIYVIRLNVFNSTLLHICQFIDIRTTRACQRMC